MGEAMSGSYQAGGIRLGIDLGTDSSAAVAALPGGRRVPVLHGQATTMPSGIFVNPDGRLITGAAAAAAARQCPQAYLADPKGHVGTEQLLVAGRSVPVVDVIAALLGALAADATRLFGAPVTSLVAAVPAGWGPRRRDVLRQACQLAGLPEPDLVIDAIAVVHGHWRTMAADAAAGPTAVARDAAGADAPPAVGDCVLVVDAGAGACTLSVLQRTVGGYGVLATRVVGDCGGGDVDAALARWLAEPAQAPARAGEPAASTPTGDDQTVDDPTVDAADARDPVLLAAARQAKEALWQAPTTVVPVPGRALPVVLDVDQLAHLSEPHCRRVGAAVAEVLDTADVDAAQVRNVLLTGGGARLPGLAATVEGAVGKAPTIVAYPDTVVADGALDATTVTGEGSGSAVAPDWATATASDGRSVRPTVGRAVLALVTGIASLAVLAETIGSVDVYPRATGSYLPNGYGGFAIAALLAMLTATDLAHATASTAPAEASPAEASPAEGRWLIRRALTAAAVIGMTIAGLYGLFATIMLDLVNTPIMKWVLLAPLPVAVGALLVGLAGTRIPPPLVPAWLRRVRPQSVPVLLTAAGTLLVQLALSIRRPWYIPQLVYEASGWAGAAALGAAIALTATRNRTLRLITVPLLGVGAAVVLTIDTANLLAVAYAAVVGWSWAVAASLTLAAAYPNARIRLARWLRAVIRPDTAKPPTPR